MSTTKKTIYMYLVGLMVVLILCGVYVFFGKQVSTPLNPSEVLSSSPSRVYSNEYISVDVDYPVMPGESEDIVKTNILLQAGVDAQIDEFDASAKETNMIHVDTIKSMIQGGYSIEASTKDWISVVGGLSFYSSGAAHPFYVIDTYVYDLQQKKLLGLSDIFKPNADYLTVLSELSRKDLYAQIQEGDGDNPPDASFIPLGTEPTTKNFRSFALLCDGLALYFGEYQVAPYAAGIQQVIIPYSKLKPYLHDRISGYTCIKS